MSKPRQIVLIEEKYMNQDCERSMMALTTDVCLNTIWCLIILQIREVIWIIYYHKQTPPPPPPPQKKRKRFTGCKDLFFFITNFNAKINHNGELVQMTPILPNPKFWPPFPNHRLSMSKEFFGTKYFLWHFKTKQPY